ncbi:LuxR family transcriptional regulator [uncultured Massilia sp.]|uniref:helix-turn-helix transcriptional regulator n=1 Tax=uncultured Massilia sp. TaxID=169973 RepID=UPI0025F291BC|nr:LuxR family transcriptional regulator [uncultured Massilia sp.]
MPAPTSHLYEFEALAAATSADELASALARQCDEMGYTAVFYSSLVSDPDGRHKMLPSEHAIMDREQLSRRNVITTYPASWVRRYQEAGYEAVDPVVRRVAGSSLPVFWDGLAGVVPRHIVFDEARDHGLANGITVPVAGPRGERALFSIATDLAPEAAPGHQAAFAGRVLLTALYLDEAVRRLARTAAHAAQGGGRPPLTRRERECLQWAATGKTSWEISTILSISERTVIFHMANATRKLGATNRRQAVVRALGLGLILP